MLSPSINFESPDFEVNYTAPWGTQRLTNTTYELFDAHKNGINTLRGHYDSAIGAIATKLALLLPEDEQRSIDCLALLDSVSGPILEIGGPTPKGYEDPLIDPSAIKRKIFITNILGQQFPALRPNDIDLYMDGAHMP